MTTTHLTPCSYNMTGIIEEFWLSVNSLCTIVKNQKFSLKNVEYNRETCPKQIIFGLGNEFSLDRCMNYQGLKSKYLVYTGLDSSMFVLDRCMNYQGLKYVWFIQG